MTTMTSSDDRVHMTSRIAGDGRTVQAIAILLRQRGATASIEELAKWESAPVHKCGCGALYRQVCLDIYSDGVARVSLNPTRLYCRSDCKRRRLARERRAAERVAAGKVVKRPKAVTPDDDDEIGVDWFVSQRDRAARALAATLNELRLSYHDYAALRKRDPAAAALLVEDRWTTWLKRLAQEDGELLQSLGGSALPKGSKKVGATTAS